MLKKLVVVFMYTALIAGMGTPPAHADTKHDLKRTLKSVVAKIESFKDDHGRLPSRRRIQKFQEQLPFELYSGALIRSDKQAYCTWYWYRGHEVTYDSVLESFWFEDRRALKHRGGYCWEITYVNQRYKLTTHRSEKLSDAIANYYDETGAFPATMTSEDQATVGYVLTDDYLVAKYVVYAAGTKVKFCVENTEGGFRRWLISYDSFSAHMNSRPLAPWNRKDEKCPV